MNGTFLPVVTHIDGSNKIIVLTFCDPFIVSVMKFERGCDRIVTSLDGTC